MLSSCAADGRGGGIETPSPALAAAARTIDEFPPPGIAVAEVADGRARFLVRGTERPAGRPIAPETVFQIASLTKPFTAIVILRLAEEGRLRLEDRASDRLDWLPQRYEAVTIRQLLTHTAGVPRDLRRENVDEFDLDEFRRRFVAADPSFEPGTRWEYANTGYTLLSMIAEQAGGQPFERLLESHIFRPVGMRYTRYRAPLLQTQGRALGHDWLEERWQPAPPVYSGFGNSGIETTAADLARFATALQRRRLLRPESYEEMLSPQRLSSGAIIEFPFRDRPTRFGLGWFLNDVCGVAVAGHGGTIAGFSSNLFWAPGRSLAILALANGKSGADRIGVAEKVAGAALRARLGCA
ncbi:MAG: beta-lactamase family protein [Pseudomonadota bacterium]|nr:beta-lactamase family protein [Pseudomonadota bacterium]